MSLTQDYVRQLFDYKDGHLIWRVAAGVIKPGTIAGTSRKLGYWQIRINKKSYLAHRIIFLYHHGYLPAEIDHIDRNPSNNRIENLRPASRGVNAENIMGRGYYAQPCGKRWRATITVKGQQKNLGRFNSEAEARAAYLSAKERYHPHFLSPNTQEHNSQGLPTTGEP